MNGGQDLESHIGRFQITSCGTDSTSTIAVLDTVTGRVWVRQIFNGIGGDKALLKAENYGRALWDVGR